MAGRRPTDTLPPSIRRNSMARVKPCHPRHRRTVELHDEWQMTFRDRSRASCLRKLKRLRVASSRTPGKMARRGDGMSGRKSTHRSAPSSLSTRPSRPRPGRVPSR